MTRNDLTTRAWHDYELIDSGGNRKLERYGAVTVIRPETQAIWEPAHPEAWKQADAEFKWDEKKGSWRTGTRLKNSFSADARPSGLFSRGEPGFPPHEAPASLAGRSGLPRENPSRIPLSVFEMGSKKKKLPESWRMTWNDVSCAVRLTSFKHMGIFPEQAANWEWAVERVMELRKNVARPNVLNLFGYTGLATIALAKRGAHVTHVDASKQSNAWAKENAGLSEAPAENIRYILDDALAFVLREIRRKATYEGVILDPPAFGRGAKGEVWRIEEHLPRLLEYLTKVLARTHGSFFLLNGYAAGYSAQSFSQAVESHFPESVGKPRSEFGELRIQESPIQLGTYRVVPQGIYARFVR